MRVKVPPVSISMEQVKVIRWLVDDAMPVRRGQSIVEVETDKAVVEVESPARGILHIKVPAASIVDATADLAEILPPGQTPRPASTRAMGKPRLKAKAMMGVSKPRPPVGSPAARRLAREHGIDLNEVRGSGPDGRIVTADIEPLVKD